MNKPEIARFLKFKMLLALKNLKKYQILFFQKVEKIRIKLGKDSWKVEHLQ